MTASSSSPACPLFGAVRSNGPPTATLLGAGAELPQNTHLWVVERWATLAPPTSTLSLLAGSTAITSEARVLDFAGRGRLHEIVPAAALSPGSYELKWRAETPGSVASEEHFAFRVGAAVDVEPPRFVATQAVHVDHPPLPTCDIWQSWRSAVAKSATDDVTRPEQLIYLVWRAGEGGLVDLALPPVNAVAGGAATIDLGPLPDEWLGVAVIDAAGHRAAPIDLPIGTPRADPRLRPLQLGVKHASTWILEHPWESGGALFAILVLVSLISHRASTKKTRA